MTEKTGYDGGYKDYDDAVLDIEVYHQEDHQQEFALDHAQDFSGVDDATDSDRLSDRVDHALDHAVDDTAQADYDEQFGWRSRARRSRKGQFVPPDMRSYRWPVFVRVADLQNQDRG